MFDDLIKFLPFVFDYYVSGAIFYFLRDRILQIKLKDSAIVTTVVFSAIVKIVVDAVMNTKILAGTPISIVRVYYIALSILLFLIDFGIVRTNFANKHLAKWHGTTFEDDVWTRILGNDGKTAITATLSDGSIITGRPMYINKEYIAIAEYRIRNKDTAFNGVHNNDELCTILIKDIKMVQTAYLNDSAVKKLNKSLG